jgi:hypothetical protein
MWKALASILALASTSVALRADDTASSTGTDREQIWELKRSPDVRAEFERRREFIEAEMATGAVPDWAGEYSNGIERNIRISVAPQGGFVYSFGGGCLGRYDSNYGSVAARDNRLSLKFELPDDGAPFGAPREFAIVRWGARIYLLADDELKPFVNAVNSGREPHRHCFPSCGSFLVRNGDDEKPVSGAPDVPGEYRRLLSDKPITGRVLRVLDYEMEFDPERGYGWRTTRVEMDIGSDDGVWEGMELFAFGSVEVGGGFEVIRTYGSRSVAVNRDVVSPDSPALESGFCVSTRPGEQTCPDEQTAASR